MDEIFFRWIDCCFHLLKGTGNSSFRPVKDVNFKSRGEKKFFHGSVSHFYVMFFSLLVVAKLPSLCFLNYGKSEKLQINFKNCYKNRCVIILNKKPLNSHILIMADGGKRQLQLAFIVSFNQVVRLLLFFCNSLDPLPVGYPQGLEEWCNISHPSFSPLLYLWISLILKGIQSPNFSQEKHKKKDVFR